MQVDQEDQKHQAGDKEEKKSETEEMEVKEAICGLKAMLVGMVSQHTSSETFQSLKVSAAHTALLPKEANLGHWWKVFHVFYLYFRLWSMASKRRRKMANRRRAGTASRRRRTTNPLRQRSPK